MPNANPTPARLPAPIPSANYRSLARRATAPLAALTMALLLFIYSRSSIHAAKRNAARHREADGGQISWANENARRHRRAIAERAGAEGGQGVGKGLQVQAEGLWRQIVSPFLKVDGEKKEKEKGKGKGRMGLGVRGAGVQGGVVGGATGTGTGTEEILGAVGEEERKVRERIFRRGGGKKDQ